MKGYKNKYIQKRQHKAWQIQFLIYTECNKLLQGHWLTFFVLILYCIFNIYVNEYCMLMSLAFSSFRATSFFSEDKFERLLIRFIFFFFFCLGSNVKKVSSKIKNLLVKHTVHTMQKKLKNFRTLFFYNSINRCLISFKLYSVAKVTKSLTFLLANTFIIIYTGIRIYFLEKNLADHVQYLIWPDWKREKES